MTRLVPNAGFELSGFPWLPLPEKVYFQEGPGILAKDFADSGVPLVRLSGLGGYEVTLNGCNFVAPEKGSGKWGHFRLKKGDILVSSSASFGRPAVVGDEAEGALFYTGLIRFIPKESDLDAGYLKAFLGSELFMRQAEAMASGSVIRHFGPTHLREMRIPVPPLPEQLAIAATLGALDDKIELNRRMNETLEAMARALFRDWFVDFGPTRAKIAGTAPTLSDNLWPLFPDHLDDDGKPEGWRSEPLLSHARLISGGTPKTDTPTYWNGGIAWASAKDVSQCGEAFLLETERNISEAGLQNSATRMVPARSTVVVARGATTGRSCMFGIDMAMNQTCYALHSENALPFWLNLAFGALVDELVHSAHGSVFDTITTRTLQTASVTIPGAGLLMAFEKTVAPLFERVLSNISHSRTLAQTRDLLLPRLMSGELRIAQAERTLEEVA